MFEFLKEWVLSFVQKLIRVGKVSSVNPENCTARVTFADQQDIVSFDLPILVRNSLKNKSYWLPDVGEQVLCIFLPVGIEQGFILGSFYSKATNPPVNDPDIHNVQFEDGTKIEYNRQTHELTVKVVDGKVIVDAPNIELGESASLEPSVLGDAIATAFDDLRTELDNHSHIGNLGAPTSPAMSVQPFEFLDLLQGGEAYSKKNKNQ